MGIEFVDGVCFVDNRHTVDIGDLYDVFTEYCCGVLEKETGMSLNSKIYFAVFMDNRRSARNWANILKHKLLSCTVGIEKKWDVIGLSDIKRIRGHNVLGAVVVGDNIYDDAVFEIKRRVRSRIG